MKKNKIIFFIIIALCIFTCIILVKIKIRKANYNPLVILNKLNNEKSSKCDISIKIMNDKQMLSYEGIQRYEKCKEHRLEFKNDIQVTYKDNKAVIFDKKNNTRYIMNKNNDCIYRLSFIDEFTKSLYLQNKIEYEYQNIDGIKYLVLNLKIPETNRNFNKAILYIDCINICPKKIIIYDVYNKEKVLILYENYSLCS